MAYASYSSREEYEAGLNFARAWRCSEQARTPRAATGAFPYAEHRNMAQVIAGERV